MGSGASTASAYSSETKAALMRELGNSYTELSKSEGGLSDIELYTQMQSKFESLSGTMVSESMANMPPETADDAAVGTAAVKTSKDLVIVGSTTDSLEESKDKETDMNSPKTMPLSTATTGTGTGIPAGKDKPDLTRIDSLAGHEVIVVQDPTSVTPPGESAEGGNENEYDPSSTIDQQFNTGAALLVHPTSSQLLEDMVAEQQLQDSKISQFMTALKDGNVKSSKASEFRTRRLTYAQKTIQDPELPSPDKLRRQRTTIYASSEIGVRQEKKAPFSDNILGTFSCHGIEPGHEHEHPPEDEEGGGGEVDEEESYGPMPHDKINQDRGCVVYPFVKNPTEALFLVLDGHGEQGDKISEFVMRQIVVSLEKHELLHTDAHEALKDTFMRTNMALMVTPINYMTSGTTCVCCYLNGTTLYVANCGDSRAVMAVCDSDGVMKSKDLSRDHKPDDPEEAERIIEWGGFVRPAPEPGLSARIYLDEGFTMIGLAMARSIGDFAVKAVGVIPEPEVKEFELDSSDTFMIMASDGVWEFIGSQEAVDIIQAQFEQGANCTQACQELIEQASQRWAEEEGDYRDDITAIVVKFPLPSMT